MAARSSGAILRFGGQFEVRIRIVFDTQFGNTERLARAIGRALAPDHTVSLVPLRDELAAHPIGDAELTFVGGPTQARGASPAMRAFLEALPELHGAAVAAFDTRVDAARILTGAASRAIATRVRGSGGRLVVAPESFLVGGRSGPLVDGEYGRAAAWARRVVEHVHATA